jgi:hypothetical protein
MEILLILFKLSSFIVLHIEGFFLKKSNSFLFFFFIRGGIFFGENPNAVMKTSTILNSIFSYCEGTKESGGIYTQSKNRLQITKSLFVNNNAGDSAGAVGLYGGDKHYITSCAFIENKQINGQVIEYSSGGGGFLFYYFLFLYFFL